MKVSIDGQKALIPVQKLGMGEIGYSEKSNRHIMRTFTGFVELDPNETWEYSCSALVEPLPPGTEIKLTVEA